MLLFYLDWFTVITSPGAALHTSFTNFRKYKTLLHVLCSKQGNKTTSLLSSCLCSASVFLKILCLPVSLNFFSSTSLPESFALHQTSAFYLLLSPKRNILSPTYYQWCNKTVELPSFFSLSIHPFTYTAFSHTSHDIYLEICAHSSFPHIWWALCGTICREKKKIGQPSLDIIKTKAS